MGRGRTARTTDAVFRLPGFGAFWTASTLSGFGSSITSVAVPVLVVSLLAATPFEVGVINAARFLPYLVFGLIAGVIVDRRPRRPTLVATSALSCLLLLAIPALWWTGLLSLSTVALVLVLLGVVEVLNAAASQSFLPRVVPRRHLVAANVRLEQSSTVAQTAGPVLGGALVTAVSAPVALVVDAVSSAIEAVLLARIRLDEPAAAGRQPLPHVLRDIREGISFLYRHRMLAPVAWSTHVWFIANSIALTVFAPFALRELDVGPQGFGIALALGGVGGLLGATLATRVGSRIGAGNTVFVARMLAPLSWAAIALAPMSSGAVLAVTVVGAGQFAYGFSMGVENPNEMGYWQAGTPDELLGRVNATRRSVNRTMFVVGSLAGGALASALGFRPAIWIAVAVFVVAAVMIAVSPFRTARHPGDDEVHEP